MQKTMRWAGAFFAALALAFGLMCAFSVDQAHAKTGIEDLKIEEGSLSFKGDVTHTGKMNTVKVTGRLKNYSYTMTLYVDGKKITSWSSAKVYIGKLQLVTLGNGKSFICISEQKRGKSVSKVVNGLYMIKKGKLSKVLGYEDIVNAKYLKKGKCIVDRSSYDFMIADSVSKNVIKLKIGMGTRSLGQIELFDVPVAYEKGRLVVKSASAHVGYRAWWDEDPYFIAKKSINVYRKTSSSKRLWVISAGQKFKIKSGKIIDKSIYLKVANKSGSKTGWIKLTTKNMVKKQNVISYPEGI